MRKQVFNHQHEVANGRSSTVGHEIMGFNQGEQVFTNLTHTTKKNKIWPDIVERSDRVVYLLDMCGHEKYLKTTMFGLTSQNPDYVCIVVGANMGVSRMTKEHIGIAWALNLPMVVVFTKTDITPDAVYKDNLVKVGRLLKDHCAKVPVLIKNMQDVHKVKDKMATGKVCPIFSISNHTGQGVGELRTFLGSVVKPTKSAMDTTSDITTMFTVDDTYMTKGLGLILCGTVVKGQIHLNQTLMFGPDAQGNFKKVAVKGIHENRIDVEQAFETDSVTLKVKTVGKDVVSQKHVRKGSCLINPLTQKEKGSNP